MREELLQKYWFTYLDWWADNIHDADKPPTEDDFWAWYCLYMRKLQHEGEDGKVL